MKLLNHPHLLDQLAAAYALGTLRGGARRRFESMARQNTAIRAAALLWQERFAAMTEIQPAEMPGPNVWKRIENLLEADRPVAKPAADPVPDGWKRALGWWRGAALGGALATIAAMGVSLYLVNLVEHRETLLAQANNVRGNLLQQNTQLASQLQARPDIQYVAVLADDKSTASMLVTFDPRKGTLTVKRVGGYQEASDKSLQLWALPPGGPKSLGVLGGDAVIKLTAAENQVRQVPALAISLEPKGGVPGEGGPTGPVLFKGALLPTT